MYIVTEVSTGSADRADALSTIGAVPDGLLAVASLGASASSVILMDGIHGGPQCLAGRGADAVEDIQFALGEGPCRDAFRLAKPIVVPRLEDSTAVLWSSFGDVALKEGFRSVFAFPLVSAGMTFGVLALYQREQGYLDQQQRLRCVSVADELSAVIAAIPDFASPDHLACATEAAFDLRTEIHQASGMVSVQLGVSVYEALVRIRAHAYAAGKFVKEVADDVVTRRLRFTDV